MSELKKLVFDSYSRQARLFPAFLTLLPVAACVWALWPELIEPVSMKGVVGFASACGVLYALASFARSQGKNVERRLLKEWGGWPTTIWLRHGGGFLPAPTVTRYHDHLKANLPGLSLPTSQEEAADPAKADAYYASAVEWLKEQCRGVNLVEKENAEYGFRRNLRGMRPYGIWLSVACIVVSVGSLELKAGVSGSVAAFFQPAHLQTLFAGSWVASAVILNALAFTGWCFLVNDKWVRQGADQYARALLSNCESTKPAATAKSRKLKKAA